MATAPPATRPAPPTRRAVKPPPSAAVAFGTINRARGQSIVLFGCGGAGKTTLAAIAPGPVAFFDLDGSLGVLAGQLPEDVDIRLVDGITTWQDIRDALHAPGWDGVATIALDSATRAEELAEQWVIQNIKHEKGKPIERIEDYGYGRGYRFVYDTFLTLLADLDSHIRAGRNVVLVAHESTEKHPNPRGEDWLRSEPRLQHTPKNSVRERVRDWCDHLLYLGFDVDVQEGKGRGSGTRTLWPTEQPHCMAKTRSLSDSMEIVKHDRTLWNLIFTSEGAK